MRRFQLHHDVDVSGVSGTGLVAEGVTFSDGGGVVRWLTGPASTVVWEDADSIEKIHGHGGATRIVWLDQADTGGPGRVGVTAREGRA